MMWMILQAKTPQDWVIATGKSTSVRDFVIMAFSYLGIKLNFEGVGEKEKGIVVSCSNPKYKIQTGKIIVEVDPHYYRPTEVDSLIGDASKAKEELGWVPKFSLNQLVNEMMAADLKNMSRSQYLKNGGFDTRNSCD